LKASREPNSYLYTKAGNLGAYAAMQASIPDFNVGFSILAAGSNSVENVRTISDIVAGLIVPALRKAVKADAISVYAGNYTDSATESMITIKVTENDPGLLVSN
jgi:hypothetical protein